MKAFPRGASAIDFAYAIHTEIGHHCTGARVNGRLVPIKTELKNGDAVEILTSPSQHPSRDWLSYVRTSNARHKIRHWLNAEERQKSLDLGRGIVEREARRHKLSPKALASHPALARSLRSLGCDSLEEFFVQVGYGRSTPQQLFDQILPQAGGAAAPPAKPAKKPDSARGSKVRVGAARDFMVSLARCCKPVRGEPIVGYITLGKGVSVHAESCPNVQNLMFDPHRRIDVAWEADDEGIFEAAVVVQAEDRPGVLAQLTSIIADEKANIRDVGSRSTGEGRARITFTLEVRDLDHLEAILGKLKQVGGITRVERAMGR